MTDQQKHLDQTKSQEEVEAIKGAENAAKNADNAPGTAPVPAARPTAAPEE